MGSDEDYMAFLNKANSDVGGDSSASKSDPSQEANTSSVNTSVPSALQSVQEYYVSDADEPFEPVSLRYDGGDGLPSPDELAKLVGVKGRAERISQKEFDPQGRYGKVVEAVKGAGSGEVGVFRIEVGGTRVEFYVVGVVDGKVVGLKAKAVES